MSPYRVAGERPAEPHRCEPFITWGSLLFVCKVCKARWVWVSGDHRKPESWQALRAR